MTNATERSKHLVLCVRAVTPTEVEDFASALEGKCISNDRPKMTVPEGTLQLAEVLEQKGYKVQIMCSDLYSYQGGKHESLPPDTRPDDWGAEIRHTVHAHDGDVLVCIATEDRYNYRHTRQLEYYQFNSLEEAFTLFLA